MQKSLVEGKGPATWMHSTGVCEGDSYINVTKHLYISILKFFLQKFFFESCFAAVKKWVLKIELHFSCFEFYKFCYIWMQLWQILKSRNYNSSLFSLQSHSVHSVGSLKVSMFFLLIFFRTARGEHLTQMTHMYSSLEKASEWWEPVKDILPYVRYQKWIGLSWVKHSTCFRQEIS